MRSTAQFQAVSALMPTVLAYAGTEQSGRIAITASPLRGIAPVVASDVAGGPNDKPGDMPANSLGSGLSGMERRAFGVDPGGKALTPEPLNQRLAPDGTPYSEVVKSLNRAIDQRYGAPAPRRE